MVAECAFVYPHGRNCRRIPRRGEALCRDHRRLASVRPKDAEAAFTQQMMQAADEIASLPLDQMLEHLQNCLLSLHGFVESRASSAERARYTRATIAVTSAIDCVLAHPRVLTQALPGVPREYVAYLQQLLQFAEPQGFAESQPRRRSGPAGALRTRMHLKTKCLPQALKNHTFLSAACPSDRMKSALYGKSSK